MADYVYAGDLQGNLWKFDLTDNNSAQWGSAFKTGNKPKPLFQACNRNLLRRNRSPGGC